MDESTAFQRGKEINLCRSCSEEKRSCCHGTEIYLTRGDVRRIHGRTGRWRFYTLKYPTGDYVEDGLDTVWSSCVGNPSRRRRVLRSGPDGACTFHTSSGCSLSIDVRPLICRLYPYVYDEKQIRGVCGRCPISCQEDSTGFLKRLGMAEEKIHRWHRMLYEEIRAEHGLDRAGRLYPVIREGEVDRIPEPRHRRYFRACIFRSARVMRGGAKRTSRPLGNRHLWWQSAPQTLPHVYPVQFAAIAVRRHSAARARFHGSSSSRSGCCPGP